MSETIETLQNAIGTRYVIDREIGSGGMATVYLAVDRRHGRPVAIKVLRKEFSETVGSERFLSEIRIAANLSHPHILPVHDSGRCGGHLHYVMPYSDGETLSERLEREGSLDIGDAVAVLHDLLDAVAHAHSRNVVHRDIKPSNVLLQGRHAVISDFGVAKALSEATTNGTTQLTRTGVAVGTPAYMAPEQAAADPNVDERADLYALGVVAYEMLTGRPPFYGSPSRTVLTQQITADPPEIRKLRPDLPEPIADFVMRSLEKQPEDRWQSATEMLEALDAAAAGHAITRVGRAGRTRRWQAVAAAIALVAGAATVGWASLNEPEVLPTSRVVVDVFENHTGDPELGALGNMLQDWLTDGLLQSGLLEVVPTITARQASAYVQDSVPGGEFRDPISALSRETRADIVVSGSIYKSGNDLRIRTSITDASDPEVPRELTAIDPVSGSPDDITVILDDVRQQLLGALAAKADRRLQDLVGGRDGAPRFEAYRVFDEALDQYGIREYRDATDLFLRAYDLDPSYPVPLLYASLSLRNHGDWQRSDSVVTVLEGRREEFSEYQKHWIDYSRAVLDGDLERARQMARRAADISPGSKAAYNWALTSLRMGRPVEAREALASLDPDRGTMRGDPRYWMRQIEASHQLGEHHRELEQIEELAKRFPEERSIFFNRVRVLSALGWTESLKAVFATEAVRRIPPEIVAVRYRNAAVDLFVHGFEEEAQEIARLGIAWIDTRTTEEERMSSFTVGMDLRARQQMAYQKGRLLEVVGERRQALEIYQELYKQLPDAWFIRAHMGVVHASLGQISHAMQIDRWLQSMDAPYQGDDIIAWRAGIAAALGDLDRGTSLVEQARREGMYWSRIHPLYHLAASLGDYPDYQALMAPQG